MMGWALACSRRCGWLRVLVPVLPGRRRRCARVRVLPCRRCPLRCPPVVFLLDELLDLGQPSRVDRHLHLCREGRIGRIGAVGRAGRTGAG